MRFGEKLEIESWEPNGNGHSMAGDGDNYSHKSDGLFPTMFKNSPLIKEEN